MHEPYVALYINNANLHFEKKLPAEPKSREIFHIPIEQIISDDFDEAAKKLGGTLLGLFQLWHKECFQKWGSANALQEDPIDQFTLALVLIERLSDGSSKDRLQLIDEILTDAAIADVDAKKYLNDEWPYLRKRLLRE